MSQITPDLKELESGEIRDDNSVYIVWRYEDVQTLYPWLDSEKALELLQEVGQSLKESSTEEGWNILSTLCEMSEAVIKHG